jgi:lipid-A-disaccharide synthase
MGPIFVVAGEASGDVLGASLIHGLKNQYPFVSFCGVGGPLMESAGSFQSIFPMTDLSHMGFSPVLWNAPMLIRRFYQTVAAIKSSRARGVLTIDSTTFCLQLGKKITNIPRVHCVAPPVWAWKRKKTTSYATDHMLSLFPFEENYFRHMKFSFIGHPICSVPKGNAGLFWEKYGPERPLLCLLPGSRPKEIKQFWPVFLKTARLLRIKIPNLLVATVSAPGTHHFWPKFSPEDCLLVPHKDKHHLFAATTVALAASGTVTIELAHQGTPMVIGYKVGKPTEWILRHFLARSVIGAINILAETPFVPECLQSHFTPDILSKSCWDFLENPALRAQQSQKSLSTMKTLWAGKPFGELGASAIGQTLGLDHGKVE